jgi:hypothetical protein
MRTANDLVVGKVNEPLELPITIERRSGFRRDRQADRHGAAGHGLL